MGLAQSQVARVISNALVAAERVRFRKPWGSAWHKRKRLVVTEAAEGVIPFRKSVVQPYIKPSVVQLTYGLIGVVDTGTRVIGIGIRVQVDHGLADRVEHIAWKLI